MARKPAPEPEPQSPQEFDGYEFTVEATLEIRGRKYRHPLPVFLSFAEMAQVIAATLHLPEVSETVLELHLGRGGEAEAPAESLTPSLDALAAHTEPSGSKSRRNPAEEVAGLSLDDLAGIDEGDDSPDSVWNGRARKSARRRKWERKRSLIGLPEVRGRES